MNITSNETFVPVNQPEYHEHFWNYLMGYDGHTQYLNLGASQSETYSLPTTSDKKFQDRLNEESLFRNIATRLYAPNGPSSILARVNTDSATWVAPGGEIPAYEGIEDFTSYNLNDHKLAVCLKLDESFLHDHRYIFEKYVIDRLAVDFAHAEEYGFICGNGTSEPTGILCNEGGATVGTDAASLTYDVVIDLFFALGRDYRSHSVWLMNDKTALALRKLKDADGNYLWNGDPENLLGRKVYISNYMPDATAGNKPIAFGDFSYYWLVDRNLMTIRTLRERFFETGQIGYLAQERLDGKLIRPDAVKVLKLAE